MDTNARLLRAAEELLQNRDDARAAQALVEAHAADIAHVLQELPLADRATIFRSLRSDQAGDVLSELDDATLLELVRSLDDVEVSMILDRMPILVWLGAALLGWIGGDVIATDPAIAPQLRKLLDGDVSLNIDTTSSMFGFVKHLKLDGEIDELVLALLGVTIVLVVGSIWRRRKLQEIVAPVRV